MKFLTPLLLIGLSIGIFFMYVSPSYDKANLLKAELTKNQLALARVKTAAATWNNLLSKEANFAQADLDNLEKLLPEGKIDTIQLIIDLNQVAEKYKVKLKNIRVSPPSETGGQGKYGSLPISFGVSLSYDNFLLFMKDLEKSLKLFDVSSITFQPTDKSNVYDYSITLKTYWLK